MDVMLWVRNLSEATTEEDLEDLFLQVGEVTSLKIMKDRDSGLSKSYGYLTMSAQSEADKAISRFNEYSFGNHRLKVSLARPRPLRRATGLFLEP
jgi:cold-inducible RNA-binding protein